ncbi:MAG TPA: hypothetical protein VHB20_19075 [Verrucomicrobiae bacterium]|jgi:hypothetical protein|nr:hypothetical protein [Verrucomicrobiae bacterium]
MRIANQKYFALLCALGFASSAGAFTVWGPAEAWQTPTLDYVDRSFIYGESENGATKILGQGARLNVPVLTYGFDDTFTEYFGTQGVKAVDAAMAVLNALPRASAVNLSTYLTDGAQQVNYTAQALSLFDVKSETLALLLEHAGLLGETHVFDLRARTAQAGTQIPCQFYYFTVLRNYDPVTYNPTAYVNGVQYGYDIVELCGAGQQVADAVEYPEDTARPPGSFTAVATKEGITVGGYYIGLTRDDVGGIRWLYRSSRLVNETLDPNSFITSLGSSSFNPAGTTLFLTNASTRLGGVEKVTYVKVGYDSVSGTTPKPITYNYTMPITVNGRVSTIHVTRFINTPDIIFTAADLVDTGFSPPRDFGTTRTTSFFTSPDLPIGGGVNGPGAEPAVIQPQTIITFNNVNPIYRNQQPAFLSDLNVAAYPLFQWGSFDGSGNAPIVYPNGSSLLQAEEQAVNGNPEQSTISTSFNPVGSIVTGGNVSFLGNF